MLFSLSRPVYSRVGTQKIYVVCAQERYGEKGYGAEKKGKGGKERGREGGNEGGREGEQESVSMLSIFGKL